MDRWTYEQTSGLNCYGAYVIDKDTDKGTLVSLRFESSYNRNIQEQNYKIIDILQQLKSILTIDIYLTVLGRRIFLELRGFQQTKKEQDNLFCKLVWFVSIYIYICRYLCDYNEIGFRCSDTMA